MKVTGKGSGIDEGEKHRERKKEREGGSRSAKNGEGVHEDVKG